MAASLDLAGVTRYVSVPVAALAVSTLVLRGSFHRVEHILLLLGSVFVTYIASGFLADPDWSAVAHGLVVPSLPSENGSTRVIAATIGTTVAP